MHSNPFKKTPNISSSDRTKRLANKTIVQTINKQKTWKNPYNKTTSHSTLLKRTHGYFDIKPCCYSTKSKPNSIHHGKFSTLNLDNVVKWNFDKKKNYYYVINKCRHQNGLITPTAEIKPVFKDKVFKYPTPLKKIYECSDIKNPLCPCDTHCSKRVVHRHYYPNNAENISYLFSVNDPNATHPPFPSQATNHMSKFNIDKSNAQ